MTVRRGVLMSDISRAGLPQRKYHAAEEARLVAAATCNCIDADYAICRFIYHAGITMQVYRAR